MTDKPIIFSPSMVEALLAGRKTQTRRILNPQPDVRTTEVSVCRDKWMGNGPSASRIGTCQWDRWQKLGWEKHDRLYVRERFSPLKEGRRCKISEATYALMMDGHHQHRAGTSERGLKKYAAGAFDHVKWAPSIHMPRWASRMTLNVTDVRVERLNNISEHDALAEGICVQRPAEWAAAGEYVGKDNRPVLMAVDDPTVLYLAHKDADAAWATAREAFTDLWESINGGGSWDANPWVAVITFDVVKVNIDQIHA